LKLEKPLKSQPSHVEPEPTQVSPGADQRKHTPADRHPDALPPVREWIPALQGWLLALYAKLIFDTSPRSYAGWEHMQAALETGRPIMLASWHGQPHMFYSAFRAHFRIEDAFLVMVGDARKSVLGYFAKYINANQFPVDMGDSSMAGARKLVDLIGKFGPGKFSYIAPDGPDGPARVAKPGVVFIARKAKALIVPVANATRYALHIPRWDRYWLPLPFSRIYTAFGPPIDPTLGTPRAELLEKLTGEINLVNERVKALAVG
jgi:lysophospholipid acyltransferase (LPLAT)-like uncharacterized protein